ncbi:MAG: hypothetical protein GC162_07810 [Planctomycetes bacterium]|nr:hypothetical protein [Planctomycetota bacterium]
MPDSASSQGNMMWLVFALLVVVFWGCYGVAMHTAGLEMGGASDPYSRYKAYIFVGVAYVIVAILAPMVLMGVGGASWAFPTKGIMYSLLAGTLGAFGAFFVLSGMGAVGSRPWMIPVVMCVVFAGAPIVNALVALVFHPPKDGWGSIHPLFWAGIFVAVIGAAMVTYYKPGPKPPAAQIKAAADAAVAPAETSAAQSK